MKLRDILKEFDEQPNYMVIQNLKQMERQIQGILQMDENELLSIMKEHPWAVDHLTTSKDDIEEVHNFLMNREHNN
jgi:hypothetical protein